MPLSLQQKQQVITDLTELGNKSMSSVVVDYRGISSVDMTELRKRARDNNITLKVIHNRLAKRAFKETKLSRLDTALTGPTLIAISEEDLGAAARLIKTFNDEYEVLEVKALTIDEELLGPEQLKRVTSLPTYEVAVSMLMSTMLAPVTQLARTLAEPVAKCVRTFAAVAQSKE